MFRLFVLLQSNFLKFDVCGIFAGTIIIFCWNRLFVLLRRIGWRFVISGILLEPVFFLAGTKFLFCWIHPFLLLQPLSFFATISFDFFDEHLLFFAGTSFGFCWSHFFFLLEPSPDFATN